MARKGGGGKAVLADAKGLFNGPGGGTMVKQLLANDMDFDKIRVNTSTLRYDEQKELDEKLLEISRFELGAVPAILAAGLRYDFDGMSATILQYEDMSDITDAELGMSPLGRGKTDNPEFTQKILPLPFMFKNFFIDARKLRMSRKLGQPLDTTGVALATRKVMELAEDILVNGSSGYPFGGGNIYGIIDHPNVNAVSLGTSWATDTGENVIADVLSAIQASVNVKHGGPFELWIPRNFRSAMSKDYSTAKGDNTIRQRILDIDEIKAVRTINAMPSSKVALVEMREETIRMVMGLQPRVVEWDTEGGLGLNFKVLGIMVPQIRADQDGNCGITIIS